MTHKTLKITAITSITILASAGIAFAGPGENCDHKKKAAQTSAQASAQASAMTTDAVAPQTAVLGASEKMTKVKKDRAILSFDNALKLCTDKGATDLQACIDYKTGVKDTYKKSTS